VIGRDEDVISFSSSKSVSAVPTVCAANHPFGATTLWSASSRGRGKATLPGWRLRPITFHLSPSSLCVLCARFSVGLARKAALHGICPCSLNSLSAICYSRSARIDNPRSNQRIGKSDRKLDHRASGPLAVRSTAVEKEITN
jgi:hypothetical protein